MQFVSSKKQNKSNLLEFIEIFENDSFDNKMRPYKHADFIPTYLINDIMDNYFPSSELIHCFSETHKIFKIRIKDLLVDSIKNWQFNRPPDMCRCPDIARYIYSSRKPIDTMLYLSYNNIKSIFEVLDGIHRLTALKIIKEENSKPLDLLCGGEFGSDNDADWLYNQYIIVNIRFNTTFEQLGEIFKTLNKSQTVPELYIRDQIGEKRKIIDSIANEWQVRYKRHFSSSANPIIGNTNRNKFVELLSYLYDKYNIDESGINKLNKILDELNYKIQLKPLPAKASIDVRLKCKETGCYLFLYKNDKLENLI